MKRTSCRTLVLLLELFAAVVAYQFIVGTPAAGAAVVWLADDPNEVADPNETVDPNAVDDNLPESTGVASRIWLADDPNDPNASDTGEELPEAAGDMPAPQSL